jgi:charged multivesicular body protein 6
MGAFGSKHSTTTTKPKTSNTAKNSNSSSITTVDRAILDLKNARDRLQKYRAKLELEEVKLTQRAREAKEAGRTQQALGLLRLKKFKSRGTENVEAQLLTVLQMVEAIDSRRNDVQMLGALRAGKDALAQLQKETTVEDILDLMDQIQEQHEVEKEVAEILSNVPPLSADDEALVEAELEALEAEMTKVENLPEVPTTKLPNIAVPTKTDNKQPARVAVAS